MEVNEGIVSGRRSTRRRWRRFLTYWYGHIVSVIGDYLTLVALPLAAFRLSGSAVVTGAVEVVEVLAMIGLGPSMGTLADRSDVRTILVGCDVARGAMMGGLALAFATDHASWPMVLAVSFVSATLRSLHEGSEAVLLARLVPQSLEVRAYTRMEAADSIGHFSGPTLGGALAAIAFAWSFGVDAFTFMFGAAMVMIVTRDRELFAQHSTAEALAADDPAVDETSIDAASFRYALAAIRREPRYIQWVAALACSNIAVVGFGALLIPFAERELRVSETVIGLMVSSGGLGGLLVTPWLDRQREVRLDHATWSLVLLASASVLAGLVVSVVTVVIGIVTLGAGFAVATIQGNAFRQQLFPPALQGRVRSATRTVTNSVSLVAILAGGIVSERVGARAVFVAFGGIALAAIVAIGLVKVEVKPPTPRPS